MNKKILGAVVGFGIVGAVGAAMYGCLPVKTYYPDGQLQTEVSRILYLKHGMYREYYKNNARLEVPYVNGKKEGTVYLHQNGEQLKLWEYKDNQLYGTFELPDGIKGQFLPDNKFELTVNNLMVNGTVNGTVVCGEEVVGDVLAAQKPVEKGLYVAKCVVIEQFNFKLPDGDVVFNGAYKFPRFTKTSTVRSPFPKQSAVVYDELAQMADIPEMAEMVSIQKHYVPSEVLTTFSENNKDVTIEFLNKDNKKLGLYGLNLGDIANLTTTGIEAGIKQTVTPELLALLKQVQLNEFSFYSLNEKPEMEFKGQFTPLLATLSKESTFNIYNPDGKSYFGIKGIDSGIGFSSAYPKSGQPFVSFNIVTDLTLLKEIQKQLAAVKSVNDYQMLGFAMMMSAAQNTPKEVTVKDVVIQDASGKIVAKADKFTIATTTGVVHGSVTVTTPTGQKVEISVNGRPDMYDVRLPDGTTQKMTPRQVTQILNDLGIDKMFQGMFEEYIKQAKEMPQTVIGIGAMAGYSAAMNRYKTNEILDMMSKYAIVVYTQYQTYKAMNGGDVSSFEIPTLCETGLVDETDNGCVSNGATYRVISVDNEGVQIRIDFEDNTSCRQASTTLGISDVTCRQGNNFVVYTVNMN